MNGNLKKIAHHAEEVASFGIPNAVRKIGASVLMRVKVQDALKLDAGVLSQEIVQFGLGATFDFVAIDRDRMPLFVMQIDSTSHMTDLPVAKELHENEICRKLMLPLVRLHALHLSKKHLEIDIMGLIVEHYLVAKGLIQEADRGHFGRAGEIDMSTSGPSSSGPRSVALSMTFTERGIPGTSFDVRKSIRRIYESGKCRSPISSSLIGVDPFGTVHAVGFIRITDETVACTRIALRTHLFPASIGDLVEEILLHELYQELLEVIRGRSSSLTRAELGATVSTFRMRYKVRSGPTSSTPPAPPTA